MKLIKVLVFVLTLALLGAPMLALKPIAPTLAAPTSQIYFSVEPTPISPLTNLNSSTVPDGNQHGLETPGGASSPVTQYFNVTILLRNATVANIEALTVVGDPSQGVNATGIWGLEVHFDFSAIAHANGGFRVCEPVAYYDMLGKTGGVLAANSTYTLSYGIGPGFFDSNGNPVIAPMATQYMVSAATSLGPWNGTGIVAVITFEIMGAPSSTLSQSDFIQGMTIAYDDLQATIPPNPLYPYVINLDVPCYIINGSLHILPVTATYDSTTLNVYPISNYSKYVIGLGYQGNMTAQVQNLATVAASFDAQYIANTTIIGAFHFASLAGSGAAFNVSIVGDSNIVGVYSFNNITVRTEPVLGESNTANNNVTVTNNNFTLIGSYLVITIPGDMNGDKWAKLSDLSLLAKCFNKSIGQPGYNPNCDIKNGGKVVLADLSLLATHFNTHW